MLATEPKTVNCVINSSHSGHFWTYRKSGLNSVHHHEASANAVWSMVQLLQSSLPWRTPGPRLFAILPQRRKGTMVWVGRRSPGPKVILLLIGSREGIGFTLIGKGQSERECPLVLDLFMHQLLQKRLQVPTFLYRRRGQISK